MKNVEVQKDLKSPPIKHLNISTLFFSYMKSIERQNTKVGQTKNCTTQKWNFWLVEIKKCFPLK